MAIAVSERHDEELLFDRYHRTGDPLAREELISRCLPLARSLASRYARAGESLEDLVQVASIGLIKAVDRFDPTRRIAFSTFAVPSILGELKRHFRDTRWKFHVTRVAKERYLAVRDALPQLTQDLGRSPTISEIGERVSLTDEEVVAEAPEIERSQSHAPRSVEPITVFETLQELASGSVNVHEA